jgi:flagellar protein FlaF
MNSFKNALRAYEAVERRPDSDDPRRLEAKALRILANDIADAVRRDDSKAISDALRRNGRFWAVILDAVDSDQNPLPIETRLGIARLASWIMDRCIDVADGNDRVTALAIRDIDINVALGLEGVPCAT